MSSFPGAGFAANENGDRFGRDASDFLAHVPHGAADAHERGAGGWRVRQRHGFAHEPSRVHALWSNASSSSISNGFCR